MNSPLTTPGYKALMTAIYKIAPARMQEARDWYAEALGQQPYWESIEHYVGFNVGGYELGLHPKNPGEAEQQQTGCCAYWGVDDIQSVYARLLALGATVLSAPEDVGGGIWVGQVIDPFGNHLGLIQNPQFPNTGDKKVSTY